MALSYSDSAALQNDMAFRGRVKVAMLKFALSIMNEASNAPAHNARYRWGQTAMQGPDQWAANIQPTVVLDPNVQSNGSTIDDPTLQSAVEATINQFI